jgi:hypothetical protein
MNPLASEPAVTIGAIGSAIGVTIVLLREFGVDVTESQREAIGNFALVVLPIVVALVTRSFVFAKDTVEDKVAEAAAFGAQGAPAPDVQV